MWQADAGVLKLTEGLTLTKVAWRTSLEGQTYTYEGGNQKDAETYFHELYNSHLAELEKEVASAALKLQEAEAALAAYELETKALEEAYYNSVSH